MIRYQRADVAAVEELVTRLSPLLLRFFSHPNRSRADTEDLLQECWLRLHRSRHAYRPSEPLLPWIFAIARHTSLDAYRRKSRIGRRETPLEDLMLPPAQPVVAMPSDTERDFSRMLERLPDSQREVLVMLKFSGMTLKEVARATSSTVGAVKQKAHRAYGKLRRFYEAKE